MKSNLTLIIALLIFSATLIAQKSDPENIEYNFDKKAKKSDPEKIVFNFDKKELSDEGKISNSNTSFRITNINTLKYKVTVTSEFENYHLDLSPSFLSYLPTSENGKKKETDNIEDNKEYLNEIINYDSSKIELERILLAYSENISELKKSEYFYKDLLNLINSDLPTEKIINIKKQKYAYYIGESAKDSSSAIIDKYQEIANSIKIMESFFQMVKIDQKDSAIIKKNQDEFIRIDTSNTIYKLASLYNQINSETFTVNYFIRKPDSDEVIINLTTQSKVDENKENQTNSIEIPIIVTKGIKVDFSGGFYFSNVADHEYTNKPIYTKDTISGYQLVKKIEKPWAFGVATYMHAYFRVSCDFNVAANIGLGIDQNTDLKILSGLSLILGKKQRFIINGGCAVGKVSVLSPYLDESRIYNSVNEPVYVEEFKIGWFVGISYNLFNNDKN